METISCNTNLFRFIRPCFYETNADPQYMFEAERMENEIYEEESFDFCSYSNAFIPEIESMADDAASYLKDIGLTKIEVLSIESPREYNFYTDWCELDITMEDGWLEKAEEKLRSISGSAVSKDLLGSWKSCSGFLSLMPESYAEIMEGLKYEDVHSFGAYLTLCLWNTDWFRNWNSKGLSPDDATWDFVTERVSEKVSYRDFVELECIIPEEYIDLYENGTEFDKDMFFHKAWERFGYRWRAYDSLYKGNSLLALLVWMKKNKKTL